MNERHLPRVGALAGAAVGIAACVALVATGVLSADEVVTGDEAADQLLGDWQRSRESSYVMEGTWAREKDGVGVMSSAVFEAQRPPDRLRRESGGVTGVLDGQTINCITDATGQFGCGRSGHAADYAEQTTQELDNLESYLAGDPALYDVASDGTCYLLQLRVAIPEPPYGRQARMCFDDDFGALRYLQVRTAGVTDTFQATSIRAVSDADFAIEAGPAAVSVLETTSTTEAEASGSTTSTLGPGATADELFVACHLDGGTPDVHAQMWDDDVSINDPRWLEADGTVGKCLTFGVFYYLSQGAIPYAP